MSSSKGSDLAAPMHPAAAPALWIDGRGRVADIPDVVRIALCTACLVVFINHAPLVDLSDRSMLNESNAGSIGTQVVFSALGLAMAAALRHLGLGRLRALFSMPLMLCAGWLAVTVLTSADPLVSIRRAILLAITALLAAGVLVVVRSTRQFALVVALSSGLIVIASYLAVAFLPNLAIHSAAYDLIMEPEHDGLWRGIFAHKNEAGSAMALLALCGLFVASSYNRALGLLIATGAAFFLVQTNSKTVLLLVPGVVLATSLCRVFTGRYVRAALLIGPIVVLTLASLGSTFVPVLRDSLSTVMPDTSFTGRTEIWEFAVEHILRRPLLGWGYGAFWGSERTMFGTSELSWVNNALQAHNAFLDVALAMGLPGLVLTMAAFVLGPVRDLQRAAPGHAIDSATLLFLRIWLLTLCTASFETDLFATNLAIGCLFFVALFGLRLRASYGLTAE